RSAHVPRIAMSWLSLRSPASLLAVMIVLIGCAPLRAQPFVSDLERAEQLYQRSDLGKAEPIFLNVLRGAEGADRQQCYERLLAIYYRVGRQDRAIAIGQDYRKWLEKSGDEARAREVLHQLGTCHLALGHYGLAREQFLDVLRDRSGL